MKTCLLAISILAALCGTAFANPITERQEAMKRISLHMRELAPYAQGKQPYDAAAVSAKLRALHAEIEAYDVETLFPIGSEEGDTKASPKIWEERAGFEAAVDKFAADIAAAAAAKPQDVEAFAPVFGMVGSNCGACHGTWRK